MYCVKKSALAAVMCLGVGMAQAATTIGNNFTMIHAAGGLTGGTNDVVFTWDGTYNTSVVTDGSSNASLSSITPFAGGLWTAHHINIYGPGTYVFNVGCPAGDPSCLTAPTSKKYELTVPSGYVGAHMLFNWNINSNIDVVQLWKRNDSWAGTAGTTDPFAINAPNPSGNSASTVWSFVSIDTPASTIRLADGTIPATQPNEDNLYHGTKMIDGPFAGFSANFNVNAVPVPAAVWLFGSGLLGLVGIARRKKAQAG